MENKKCPICGAGKLARVVTNEPFEYKGQSVTIDDYVTYRCNVCEEEIVDNSTRKKSSKIINEFKRRVDGLLPSEEIERITAKLNLTQKQMAEILGGGLKAFARYKAGTVCQSRAMDNLLRILDAYPNTIHVLRIDRKELHVTRTKVVSLNDFKNQKEYVSKAKPGDYSMQEKGPEYGT